MQFKTTIDIPHSNFEISHETNGLSIGSCFSTNIGNHLLDAKFPISVNPLGTVYNPVSIANTLDLVLGNETLNEQDVFFANGVWQSYKLHTTFSSTEQTKVLQNFRDIQDEFSHKCSTLDYLIITLGTAWVYELRETKQIVNNCHKTPSTLFNRRRLSVEECVTVLSSVIKRVRLRFPNLHVIFTISPIRHWKDGAHENQLSKSTLFLAIDKLITSIKNIEYFPAYEILMDDLRDYRFYDIDMLHPNQLAIAYIWELFSTTYFSTATQSLIQRIESLKKAVEHRPFNSKSKEYKTFVVKTIQSCDELHKEYPRLDLTKEISTLRTINLTDL